MQRCDQRQAFCVRCRRPTLHSRWAYEVPHLLHLLVTLFSCSFWTPIWLLHTAVNIGSGEPFLCQTCGQRLRASFGTPLLLGVAGVLSIAILVVCVPPIFDVLLGVGDSSPQVPSRERRASPPADTPVDATLQPVEPVSEKLATEAGRNDEENRAAAHASTGLPSDEEPDLRPTFPNDERESPPTPPPPPPAPAYRTWNVAVFGEVEARFRGVAFGKVTLVRRDGGKITVPIGDLSSTDQEWIKSRRANSHLMPGDGE